jgi:hypothetical protein
MVAVLTDRSNFPHVVHFLVNRTDRPSCPQSTAPGPAIARLCPTLGRAG